MVVAADEVVVVEVVEVHGLVVVDMITTVMVMAETDGERMFWHFFCFSLIA